MKELVEALKALLTVVQELFDSPPAVIILILTSLIGLLLWKLIKYVFKYSASRAVRLGHMESIAVSYKVLCEDKMKPLEALKEIQRELDDLGK